MTFNADNFNAVTGQNPADVAVLPSTNPVVKLGIQRFYEERKLSSLLQYSVNVEKDGKDDRGSD